MTHKDVDQQSELQLRVLGEIRTICKMIEINFWLRGGWAIDFLLGKITRLHEDIDLITWVHHREHLEDELVKAGYQKVYLREEFRDRQSDFRKGNVELSFCYISCLKDGEIVLNGLPEWVWRENSLSLETYTLKGVSSRVLNPRQLLEEKEVYEGIGRPYRLMDDISKKMLTEIIRDTMV